uniref:Uncharacterized protein n=1 Tax=Lutzomyia longipalpis TaxID=7200 RepID=A0A1B0CM57_LUTLO
MKIETVSKAIVEETIEIIEKKASPEPAKIEEVKEDIKSSEIPEKKTSPEEEKIKEIVDETKPLESPEKKPSPEPMKIETVSKAIVEETVEIIEKKASPEPAKIEVVKEDIKSSEIPEKKTSPEEEKIKEIVDETKPLESPEKKPSPEPMKIETVSKATVEETVEIIEKKASPEPAKIEEVKEDIKSNETKPLESPEKKPSPEPMKIETVSKAIVEETVEIDSSLSVRKEVQEAETKSEKEVHVTKHISEKSELSSFESTSKKTRSELVSTRYEASEIFSKEVHDVHSSLDRKEEMTLQLRIEKKSPEVTEITEIKTPSPSKSPLKEPVEFHEVIQIPFESTFLLPTQVCEEQPVDIVEILEITEILTEDIDPSVEYKSFQGTEHLEIHDDETTTGHSEEPDSLVPHPEINFIPLDKIHLSAVNVSSLASSVLPPSVLSDAAEGSDVVLQRSPERKTRRSRTEDTMGLGDEFLRTGKEILEDDSPQLTDVTSSSITNVTDRIESSLETDWTVDDESADHTPVKSVGHMTESEKTIHLSTQIKYESEKSMSTSDNAASDISNESMRKFVSNLPHDSDSSLDAPKLKASSSDEKMSPYGHEEAHRHIIEKTQKVESSSPFE